MIKPIIALAGVGVIRDKDYVIKDVNLAFYPKQHWVIMGPNGCGKSTLLEVCCGYLWPSCGEVFLMGGKLGEVFLPDLRKEIGLVSPWVLKHLKSRQLPVEDIIASGCDASIGFVDKISSKTLKHIRYLLNKFDAGHLLGRLFNELSSGEQIKVIICRALINKPKILVLDEPFAHLDMGVRVNCHRFLANLAKNKKFPSILMVTHHQEDIKPYFTHALLIKEGVIQFKGAIKKVITKANLKSVYQF